MLLFAYHYLRAASSNQESTFIYMRPTAVINAIERFDAPFLPRQALLSWNKVCHEQGTFQMIRGTCLCGAVAFEVQGIIEFRNCHCSRCRKAHGADYAANLELLPDGRISIKHAVIVRLLALCLEAVRRTVFPGCVNAQVRVSRLPTPDPVS